MVYYDKKTHTLIRFTRSNRRNKMYDAVIQNSRGKLINIPFGDKRYENYHDLTGLNLYPHLNHGDRKRRDLYKKRHKVYLKKGYYSPSYFSYFYLW